MIELYDNPLSANCYKVRLLLSQLNIPFETETISVVGDRDAQRGEAFFAKNPIGKIPTVVLDDGTVLAESTAILWYFALGSPFLPDDRLLPALLGFNVGVEIGQLAIVGATLALSALALARWRALPRALLSDTASGLLCALGVYWWVERAYA